MTIDKAIEILTYEKALFGGKTNISVSIVSKDRIEKAIAEYELPLTPAIYDYVSRYIEASMQAKDNIYNVMDMAQEDFEDGVFDEEKSLGH